MIVALLPLLVGLASAQSPICKGGRRALCVGAVFVECGDCVFVDGAIRALPRAAARAQSSAEALVLAIAAILVSRLPFTYGSTFSGLGSAAAEVLAAFSRAE